MTLPDFKPEYKPQFNVGDKVWVIDGSSVEECEVRSIVLELVRTNDPTKPILVCTGYRVGILNFDLMDDMFRPAEVYGNEQVATELAKWHDVVLSEDEWKRAIGLREDDDSKLDSELPPCCANISVARDLLFRCKEYKGMIERNTRVLKGILIGHGYPPHGVEPVTNMDKILQQLGILQEVRI